MLVYPPTLRKKMCELTAMSSPFSPSAVIALARKVTLVNDGLAETDSRMGVDVQLLIATSVTAGFEVPRNASPCPASLSRLLETGIEVLSIVTSPNVRLEVPNLSRQRETEPVEPGW